MLALILAAVAYDVLSLTSTNQYYFTEPFPTNAFSSTNLDVSAYLQGRTYLLKGGQIPRYEDIAFLKEAVTERARAINFRLAGEATVPSSLAFGSGNLGYRTSLRGMFAPSFGYPAGYTAYETAFFLNETPEIKLQWDFEETDAAYHWRNGADTSRTNSIWAFVANPTDYFVPTSKVDFATLDGVVFAGNSMSFSNGLHSIVAAYSILTNKYRILSYPSTVWSDLETNKSITTAWNQYRVNEQYDVYRGGGYTNLYLRSFQLGPKEWSAYTNVSVAPTTRASYRYTKDRMKTRVYSYHLPNDVFQVGSDYESSLTRIDDLNGSGNLTAYSPALDAMLTNVVTNVTCIVVARFRAYRREMFYNYAGWQSTPANNYFTNYFVVVAQGDAKKTNRKTRDGSSVWDAGVSPLLQSGGIKTIVDGMGYTAWVDSCPQPTLNVSTPTNVTTTLPYWTVGADISRELWVNPLEIIPYFYFERKWNACLPSYER